MTATSSPSGTRTGPTPGNRKGWTAGKTTPVGGSRRALLVVRLRSSLEAEPGQSARCCRAKGRSIVSVRDPTCTRLHPAWAAQFPSVVASAHFRVDEISPPVFRRSPVNRNRTTVVNAGFRVSKSWYQCGVFLNDLRQSGNCIAGTVDDITRHARFRQRQVARMRFPPQANAVTRCAFLRLAALRKHFQLSTVRPSGGRRTNRTKAARWLQGKRKRQP